MTPHDGWTLDALIGAYRQHQGRTRGLRDQTLRGYERLARLLVRVALGDDPIDPTRLNPSDVMAFAASMRGSYSPRSMRTVRTALRSFFRFLRVQGLCDEQLEVAIPAVAHWRLSTLPRCLSNQQLERLLTSLDSSGPCGSRDRAIVLCLSSLGLRPGEVANLRLEDIDWRDGTVELRTRKTRRGAVLPLTSPPIGAALSANPSGPDPITDRDSTQSAIGCSAAASARYGLVSWSPCSVTYEMRSVTMPEAASLVFMSLNTGAPLKPGNAGRDSVTDVRSRHAAVVFMLSGKEFNRLFTSAWS